MRREPIAFPAMYAKGDRHSRPSSSRSSLPLDWKDRPGFRQPQCRRDGIYQNISNLNVIDDGIHHQPCVSPGPFSVTCSRPDLVLECQHPARLRFSPSRCVILPSVRSVTVAGWNRVDGSRPTSMLSRCARNIHVHLGASIFRLVTPLFDPYLRRRGLRSCVTIRGASKPQLGN